MKFNKKIVSIIFLSVIAAGLCMCRFRRSAEPTSSSQTQNNRSHQILDELRHEDQRLWQELAEYGIDEKQCAQYKKEFAGEYRNIRKEFEDNALKTPISEKTLTMIHRIFDEFNINKKAITVIPFKTPGSPAAATDHQLLINEQQLLQFPFEAQEYVIAHEVQHIIHRDDSTSFVLENLIELSDKDFENPEHIINKRARFEERRADTLASMKKPLYAQGNILFMKKLLEQRKRESAGITHPKEKTRIALAENILTHYHQAKLA